MLQWWMGTRPTGYKPPKEVRQARIQTELDFHTIGMHSKPEEHPDCPRCKRGTP